MHFKILFKIIHCSGRDKQMSGCLLFDHINKLLQSKQTTTTKRPGKEVGGK